MNLILAAAAEPASLLETLLNLIPILLFILLLVFYFRKNQGVLDQTKIHMKVMEEKTDRMIRLLEELNQKK